MNSNQTEQQHEQQIETNTCNVRLIIQNPKVTANFVFEIPNRQRSRLQQQISTRQRGNRGYAEVQNSGERQETQQNITVMDFLCQNNKLKQLIYEVEFNYTNRILGKELKYSVKKVIKTEQRGQRFKIDDKIEFLENNFPIKLQYLEKDREFSQGELNFRAKVALSIFDVSQYNDSEQLLVKERSSRIIQDQAVGQQQQMQAQNAENLQQQLGENSKQGGLQNSLIKITQGTDLRTEQINQNYSFQGVIFNLGRQSLFCWRSGGELTLSLELQKIIQNRLVNITNIRIASNRALIQSVVVYVCYQFEKRTFPQATPIRILDQQQFEQNSENNRVTLRANGKFPPIYESDELSCKHLVIFNIQFQKQNYIQVYPNLDIIFPIVLLQESINNNHEYVTRNYFRHYISEELVQFKRDQNNIITPEYLQLLS